MIIWSILSLSFTVRQLIVAQELIKNIIINCCRIEEYIKKVVSLHIEHKKEKTHELKLLS